MPGTVLLLAASPVGRGRLVDAASVLPVLAAVPPAVLSGTDTATVVELADPLEPQAVLTRLRAAAAAPGPLTVFVTGQLQLDRRQHLPHLALARTTPATVRYTALPWHWLREELRLRPAGTTTLVADLHADEECWRLLRTRPLDSGRTAAVYGRIAPPPPRRTVAAPAYMKAVATILRSGRRPPLDQLHQQVLGRLAEESAGTDLVLTAQPQPPAGPYARTVAGGAYPGADAFPGGGGYAGTAAGGQGGVRTGAAVGGPGGVYAGAVAGGQAVTAGTAQDGSAGVAPGTAAGAPPGTPTGTAAGGGAVAGAGAPDGAGDAGGVPGAQADPHAAISACVQAGRHDDADALASRWEQAAVRAHGAASENALHWTEVRADLAMLAGDAARSCRAWLAVAATRLAMGQSPGTAEVEAAVDRAHHQWGRIDDPAEAGDLGPLLADLRGRVPGRRRGAVEDVRRQLDRLRTRH
ncbi:hypothetical protein [Streptomyces sp. NPDC003697]